MGNLKIIIYNCLMVHTVKANFRFKDQIPKSTSSLGPPSASSSRVQPHSASGALQHKSLPQSQTPRSQAPALNVRVPPSNLQPKSKSSVALERLQSLGLSVTVKEKQKLRPQNILPKPQSNT